MSRLLVGALLLLAVTACAQTRVVREPEPAPPNRPAAKPTPIRAMQRPTPPPVRSPLPEGIATYTVQAGDTVYGIAFRANLNFRDLAAWNGISEPYVIRVGQRLRLKPPVTTATGPQPSLPAPATAFPPSPSVPAAAPSASTTTYTTTAQDGGSGPSPVLPTPSAAKPPTAPVAPVGPKPVLAIERPAAESQAMPASTPIGTAGSVEPPAVATAIASQLPPPATGPAIGATPPLSIAGQPRWHWPAAGPLIGRFVAGDQTQQGINIAGSAGQPVAAAADGVVVYSGSGLVGYGELIIIKHSNEWLSAYAHNRRRLVSEGAQVKAGQVIAEMGRSGAARDMLHFEIRRNGKPVDPLQWLPGR